MQSRLQGGVINQARLDAQGLMSVKCIGLNDDINNLMELSAVKHETNDWKQYLGDLSRQPLDQELTQAASREETGCVHTRWVSIGKRP